MKIKPLPTAIVKLAMKHSIRTFTIFLLALLASVAASAQSNVSVKLKLIDSKTSDPVSFATVSLTVKGEEAPAKYVLSDIDGKAELAKMRRNTYILKAELMGYKPYSQELKVDKDMDLGEIKMDEDVEVESENNPFAALKDMFK